MRIVSEPLGGFLRWSSGSRVSNARDSQDESCPPKNYVHDPPYRHTIYLTLRLNLSEDCYQPLPSHTFRTLTLTERQADRHRHGEPIASGFVESAANLGQVPCVLNAYWDNV